MALAAATAYPAPRRELVKRGVICALEAAHIRHSIDSHQGACHRLRNAWEIAWFILLELSWLLLLATSHKDVSSQVLGP
eukprot:scaffold656_cov390-Prasinococcus_capsulatus_cf.AAC.4